MVSGYSVVEVETYVYTCLVSFYQAHSRNLSLRLGEFNIRICLTLWNAL